MNFRRASTSCTFYNRWTRSCFAFQLFVSFPCLPCSALPVVLFLSSFFTSSILPPPSSPSSKRGGTAKCPERVGFGSSKQSWLNSFPPEYLRYWDQATDCPTPCIALEGAITSLCVSTDLLVWRDGHEHGVVAHIGDVQTSHVPFLKISAISYVTAKPTLYFPSRNENLLNGSELCLAWRRATFWKWE